MFEKYKPDNSKDTKCTESVRRIAALANLQVANDSQPLGSVSDGALESCPAFKRLKGQVDALGVDAFDEDARSLVLAFVPTIASAVQNARLFDQEREALRRLTQ